ncbi:hypothetical protein KEJ21_07160 [Candidatus Bathyarchaeota archaeon]|nr:hypothetical protein [Candidatus Bathyarchaeota archaeon]
MELKTKLLYSTPHLETLIATAILTTTSPMKPSKLFKLLLENPEKTSQLLRRIETHHGSILEHNRVYWIVEADDSEVLNVLLCNRFFTFTRIEKSRWLMSANLRSIIDLHRACGSKFSSEIIKSLAEVVPNIYESIKEG